MACCAIGAYVICKMIYMHTTIKARTDKITVELGQTKTESCRLKITGITCPACVESIESALKTLSGIRSANVSQYLHQAMVMYDPCEVMVEEIILKIEDTGFDAERMEKLNNWADDIRTADEERTKSIRQWKVSVYGSMAVAVVIVVIDLIPTSVLSSFGMSYYRLLLEAVLCGMSIVVFGRQLHREAFAAIRSARTDMSLLTSMGTSLSFGCSMYEFLNIRDAPYELRSSSFQSTAILLCIVIGGRLLKSILVRQSVSSLSSLTSLMNETAVLLSGPQFLEKSIVSAAQLQAGDLIAISPGDIIPVTGRVRGGSSSVSEGHISGEVLPKLKSSGVEVYDGSINHDGHLIVEVTKPRSLTWLQHTMQVVMEGENKKASLHSLGESLSSSFCGFILVIAMATFANSVLFRKTNLVSAIYELTAVLLCACPCALGLASPTAVMIGLGMASEQGILIKGGSRALESAARVNTILFDKTGTLTTGQLSVTESRRTPRWEESENSFKWWLAVSHAEQRSKHPIAKAITTEARKALAEMGETLPSIEVLDFKNNVGRGVACRVRISSSDQGLKDELNIVVGSRQFLEAENIKELPAKQSRSILADKKDESVYDDNMLSLVAINGSYAGHICCADMVRVEAAVVVRRLKSMGYQVGMMTGGDKSVAESIAQAVGIHQSWVFSELLPTEKLRIMNKIRAQHGQVAMIGDNLNDVQSMAAADFSVAAFVDINSLTAVTADALLLDDSASVSGSHHVVGLEKLPYLFGLSKRVYTKIWQNLLWAIVYNTFAVTAAVGMFESLGFVLTPVYAGLGMSLSSIVVLVNITRLQ